MPPKKPLPKPKAVAAPKPLPEAMPRYLAPAKAAEPIKLAKPSEPNDWPLAFSFWWAMAWRTFLLVMPATLVVQIIIMLIFASANGQTEPTPVQAGISMLITLLVSVLLQVAVVRHMVRKKEFRGFTITLKKR